VPKILLFRSDAGHDLSELTLDEHVIAVASDVAVELEVPVLDLNDVDGIAQFIVAWSAV
jgi:molybdopterin-guanine dinucleotide biosynthesis protein B